MDLDKISDNGIAMMKNDSVCDTTVKEVLANTTVETENSISICDSFNIINNQLLNSSHHGAVDRHIIMIGTVNRSGVRDTHLMRRGSLPDNLSSNMNNNNNTLKINKAMKNGSKQMLISSNRRMSEGANKFDYIQAENYVKSKLDFIKRSERSHVSKLSEEFDTTTKTIKLADTSSRIEHSESIQIEEFNTTNSGETIHGNTNTTKLAKEFDTSLINHVESVLVENKSEGFETPKSNSKTTILSGEFDKSNRIEHEQVENKCKSIDYKPQAENYIKSNDCNQSKRTGVDTPTKLVSIKAKNNTPVIYDVTKQPEQFGTLTTTDSVESINGSKSIENRTRFDTSNRIDSVENAVVEDRSKSIVICDNKPNIHKLSEGFDTASRIDPILNSESTDISDNKPDNPELTEGFITSSRIDPASRIDQAESILMEDKSESTVVCDNKPEISKLSEGFNTSSRIAPAESIPIENNSESTVISDDKPAIPKLPEGFDTSSRIDPAESIPIEDKSESTVVCDNKPEISKLSEGFNTSSRIAPAESIPIENNSESTVISDDKPDIPKLSEGVDTSSRIDPAESIPMEDKSVICDNKSHMPTPSRIAPAEYIPIEDNSESTVICDNKPAIPKLSEGFDTSNRIAPPQSIPIEDISESTVISDNKPENPKCDTPTRIESVESVNVCKLIENRTVARSRRSVRFNIPARVDSTENIQVDNNPITIYGNTPSQGIDFKEKDSKQSPHNEALDAATITEDDLKTIPQSEVKPKKPDEVTMPDIKMNIPDIIATGSDVHANKENVQGLDNVAGKQMQYDLSIFSDSPAKCSKRRDTVFRLFDPLYQSPETEKPAVIPEETVVATKSDGTQLISIGTTNVETQKKADELSRIKLALCQLRQDSSNLKLKILQKDEAILKIVQETEKKENAYKTEIKQLTDKLNQVSSENSSGKDVSSLKEEVMALKAHEAELREKVDQATINNTEYKKVLEGYEVAISRIILERNRVQHDHEITKKHLDTLEMAFSDVYTKFVRCKDIIFGYKNNEEQLLGSLEDSNQICKQLDGKYELLKAHAYNQIDRANTQINKMRELQLAEHTKYSGNVRCLEIKYTGVKQSLEQKIKECSELAKLCSEISGSR